jgi:5'-3' exonuclease
VRTILIDADVLAYQSAAACEVATDWGEGYWTWHCDINEVKHAIITGIEKAVQTLNGNDYRLCLTDSAGNFRRSVLPTYKGNRANVKKPLVLRAIRQWLIDDLGAYFRPGLEGDDCLGILHTMGMKGETVVLSIDKDMKTVPGLFCRDLSTEEIVSISESEADYWHLFQTLTGDATDGYSGCPGIGPKKAEAILAPWDAEVDVATMWKQIVKVYEKAGLSEEEALVQARVARILRASDYDFNNKRPILWTPSSTKSVAVTTAA